MSLEVIDAQVHVWAGDSPAYPWQPASAAPERRGGRPAYERRNVSPQQMIAMMDAVGVEAALLVSPLIYGADHRYALDAARAHPGRFGVVGPLTPSTAEVEQRIATFRDQPHALAIRVVPPFREPGRASGSEFARLFAAAEAASVPVFLVVMDAAVAAAVARSHPGLQLIVDFARARTRKPLGSLPLHSPAERLECLAELLQLAENENVAVVCTDTPSMSSEPYPHADLWEQLSRLIAAFGPERILWGSDITVHLDDLPYDQAVGYLRDSGRLSAREKELILGGSLRRILRWARAERAGRGR